MYKNHLKPICCFKLRSADNLIKDIFVFYLEMHLLCCVKELTMFSKTCEYAIRAMIYIAHRSKDGSRVGIKEIAQGIDSPEHFIAKILQDLGRRGLVQSAKGPTGGFYHDQYSLKRSLADVVKAIDGDKIFTGCGLGLKECSEDHPCPIHNQFKKIRGEMKLMLENAKMGELSEELEQSLTFLKR